MDTGRAAQQTDVTERTTPLKVAWDGALTCVCNMSLTHLGFTGCRSLSLSLSVSPQRDPGDFPRLLPALPTRLRFRPKIVCNFARLGKSCLSLNAVQSDLNRYVGLTAVCAALVQLMGGYNQGRGQSHLESPLKYKAKQLIIFTTFTLHIKLHPQELHWRWNALNVLSCYKSTDLTPLAMMQLLTDLPPLQHGDLTF